MARALRKVAIRRGEFGAADQQRTYEVDWSETSRDLYGTVKTRDRWKGSFTIALDPPTDERLARINPLGIYIIQASWSKVL